MFQPKFFTCIKNYSLNQFYKDVTSGIIVAIIALPLSIALAIASGVSPEKGLHTAIIAGFIISFLGGSRVQIGGPTGAFMVIVFGIISKYGIDGLIVSTIMAGIMMILMGIFRFGKMIKFIPYPITTGFTSGIALTIFSTQIKDFFGLAIDNIPSEFISKWGAYFTNFGSINWTSTILGVASLLIIVFWPKINKTIPGSLIALIVITSISYFLKLDVETIGSKYGEISSALPKPHIPNLSLQNIRELVPPAFTIAILGSIESLLSAVVADGMIGGKHRSNTELIAQGLANIASGVFGGIPATGAIARTAANIKNGGRTPVAGMIHSVTLLLIMLIFMPFAKLIPLTTLAAILMVVAYNMSEWREFKNLLGAPKSDILVLISTFTLTVVIDLVVAIEVGIVLASLLFMKRMADITNIKNLMDDNDEEEDEENIISNISKDTLVYEINGPFFFGAADKFKEVLNEVQGNAKVLIIQMAKVPAMDATAFHALETLYKNCRSHKMKLMLSGVQEQPYSVMEKYGFIDRIGKENICESLNEALEAA
ncbi:sulfate permease [Clostridium bovifaecis]|uniref:Sulfate permease n=1 Tax=Clostridium bovifaecis TaxID=2184719 RepID=A0A6I6EST3_9CLOT|nr:sulfate permease [Clostridium bovifaecis]